MLLANSLCHAVGGGQPVFFQCALNVTLMMKHDLNKKKICYFKEQIFFLFKKKKKICFFKKQIFFLFKSCFIMISYDIPDPILALVIIFALR